MATKQRMKDVLAAAIYRTAPAIWIRWNLLTRNTNYEPELWLVPRLLKNRGIAVDVGSNVGIWSLQLCRYAHLVHAFEPNPICLRQLARVLPKRATAHAVALSDRAGTAKLRFDPDNTGIGTIETRNRVERNPGAGQIETIDVLTAPLDDFDLRNVELIKIDVEGHEEAVLRGAEKTLRRDRPALIVEIEERYNPGGLIRLREYLRVFGYQVCSLDRGQLRLLEAIESERRCPVASADGIYNFVFVARADAVGLIMP